MVRPRAASSREHKTAVSRHGRRHPRTSCPCAATVVSVRLWHPEKDATDGPPLTCLVDTGCGARNIIAANVWRGLYKSNAALPAVLTPPQQQETCTGLSTAESGPHVMHIEVYVSVPLVFPPESRAHDASLAVIVRFPLPLIILGTDFLYFYGSSICYMSGPRFRPTPEAPWVRARQAPLALPTHGTDRQRRFDPALRCWSRCTPHRR